MHEFESLDPDKAGASEGDARGVSCADSSCGRDEALTR
jgi:hypothetical protein